LRDTLFVRKPEQRVGGATNNYVYGLITSGEQLQESKYSAQIDLPIRMVAAQTDVVVNSPVAEFACNNSLPDCTLIKLRDTGHCLMLEPDAVLEKIFAEVDILAAHLERAP
jgi:pimeloyl-ACP methyl ester carboxylesterase